MNTKTWEQDSNGPALVPARHVYLGESFLIFLKWLRENEIESKGFKWLILRTKYGYTEPWHPIGN